MNPIVINIPQDIGFHEPVPAHGCCAIVLKVMNAVANFFRMIGLWFVEIGSWFKDRVIDFLPERIAIRLDPIRLERMREILGVAADQQAADIMIGSIALIDIMIGDIALIPVNEREEVFRNAVLLISPNMTPLGRIWMIRATNRIPVNERDTVMALALQVITEDMNEFDRIEIVEAITAIPAPERSVVIQHALQLINPQMHAYDRVMIISDVVNIPADLRARYVQLRRQGQHARVFQHAHVAAAQGINVHEGDRDQRVRAAIQRLQQRQGQISRDKINQAVQQFTHYLDNRQMNAEHKQLAQYALLAPKRPNEAFGPLLSEDNFSILGLLISGQEVIARLWIFASELKEPDQTNVKDSMIFALKDSYHMGSRVCDQGKTQRLVVGVLQGRLEGVDIELREEIQVPTHQAIEMFFNVKAHRNIEQLEPLLGAANRFCDENSAVNRADFVREIREYARIQGFAD